MRKASQVQREAVDLSPEAKRARLARLLKAKGGPKRAVAPATLHRLFEAQAKRSPAAPALTVGGSTLSYGELDRRADRLARHLRGLGIGRGKLVGLFIDRSAEMIVGLLGVLKAGGAYVPIDLVHPPDRLAFLLADSGVPVVLTRSSLLADLPPTGARVVCLDRIEDGDAPDEAPPGDEVRGEDLAYVIYTSGSTGRPKGVEVTHANVARLFSSTRRWFDFSEDDVWTMFHSFAFDFSVWEIWGALLHGGRLVVVPRDVSRSPDAFRDLLRDERVTVLNQTPSAFRQLIRADEGRPEEDELELRLVIFGGEALELQSLRPWFDRHGDIHPRLVNMYGITETTVHVTYREITLDDLDRSAGSSPIGRAIPDLRVCLLDRNGQPVPVGVVGEIFVGGPGVARGYLGRPALTADRFIPDPLGDRPGARLYRSGDLARYRKDGELEYVGRSDHQVKVRGFRVELGEVEAAVARHPGVREAVVVARADSGGDARLVAYLVPRHRPSPSTSEFRRHLKQTLPDYMVPSAFVAVDAFPLTPNGKVDLGALPDPDGGRPRLDGAYVSPVGPVEEVVASIWAAVLGIDRVGAQDNFFDLGGHSLLATQVISRVRSAFAVSVPLRPLFEDPTVAGLARAIEAARRGEVADAPSPIARSASSPDEPIPLSYAQQALWFLDRLSPGRATFNVSAAIRVVGPFDLDALDRSFAAIVRRHDSLRTTFASRDGRPVQVIAPASAPGARIIHVDLRSMPEARRAAEAADRASREAGRPFDLAEGPLARVHLYRLGDADHVLLMVMHHAITDGWSLGIAARELAELYAADLDGKAHALDDLVIQQGDFARWQRDWLRGATLEGLLGYWTRQLAGLETLEPPTDRPRPAVRSARGSTRFFEVPGGLSRALIDLGRKAGVTPYMTLLAAFQVLLHKMSGQDDIAVGSPIAGRNRAEVEPLIGYFVNMLVLRGDLAGDPTFLDLLARTREAALGAFEHQDLPFDRLVEALRPARDLGRTPLFQVMFVLQNNRLPDVARHDLALLPFGLEGGSGTAKFDLTLALVEAESGFAGSFEYDLDLFDPSTIDRMVARFLALLGAVAADPSIRLSGIDLATDAERFAAIEAPNRTAADFPEGSTLHRLFEAQAARAPGAIAISRGDRRMTYGELDAAASALASRLARRGVGRGARVGLFVERSFEMAVGILGILKAGAAYVPIDPAYPRDRVAALLADADLVALLAPESIRGRLPEVPVALLGFEDAGDPANGSVPLASSGPGDAAYVIYTSGSTGLPRGVVVPHRSVVNHAVAAARLFGIGAEDRVLQFSSISFDIAVEELFPAWSTGASVVLRGDDGQLDPSAFTDLVARERITVLDLPTAYWHAWAGHLAATGAALPASLRLVIVGGERALPTVHRAWRSVEGADRVRWINTYGPTEATVIATSFEPPAADGDGPGAGDLPIGRPIANVRVYLLDDRLRPTPPDLAGELFIGGVGVADGYLGRPGATAERFLPDPFSTVPGARMFRTGDRARWRLDGQLEFLGRVDDQVKVRGFRVEPGEVEAALIGLPGVASAAVLADREAPGGPRLVAYVVPDGPGIDPTGLRSALADKLPGYMVPAAFAMLDALPMTPTGKVDRRALPTLVRAEAARVVPHRPSRDEVEARLVAIWEDVLGVRPIGIGDNFFDLGGHSLLAIRLLARVEEAFGRDLPLATLFLGPTIEEVANLIRGEGDRAAGARSPLVALQPRGDGRPFFCVHPAGGIAYCFRDLARELGEGRPFLAFQAPGLDGECEPLADLVEMAARYVEAIRAVQPAGPYHLGGWSLGGLVAFEMARQIREAGDEVATLALFDTGAPGTNPDRPVDPAAVELGREIAALGRAELEADESADAELLAAFAADLASAFGGDLARMTRHFRGLSAEGRRDLVFRHFRIDRVYTEEAGPERRARLWNVLRASLLAWARYRPGPFDGKIIVFRAADAPRNGRPADPSMGWNAWARGGTSSHPIPGDHAGILADPGVARLAALLRAEIEAGEATRR